MCIFSLSVLGGSGASSVSETCIFARQLEGGRQALVYAMKVAVDEPLAMVLPLPVMPASGDDAVHFINLERYPRFFEDLAKAFEQPEYGPPARSLGMLAVAGAMLEVHEVGAFVASYVPSPADFERLDPRFRLPGPVLAAHPDYADWGFAVFQLAPRRGIQSVHPMAFSFPSRRPRALFFPTLHVHDGDTVPDQARFDHTLFCQASDPVFAHTLPWETSAKRVGKCVSARRAKHVVAPRDFAQRRMIGGIWANKDTWLDPPACAGPHVLHGRGERFRFELRAGTAYDTAPVDARARRRSQTARTRLDGLHAGMVEGLGRLTAEKADAWELGSFVERKPSFWQRLRGDEIPLLLFSNGTLHSAVPIPIWGDQSVPDFVGAGTPGPFAVEIGASSEHVERQNVRFVFRVAPGPKRIAEIERAVAEILDRAVS